MNEKIDIQKVMMAYLHAIRPAMDAQKVNVNLSQSDKNYYCSIPLDEVLGPVFYLLLKLVYILPPDREINVRISERTDPSSTQKYLVIDILTYWLTINPNLIFRPENNRFKIEQDEHRNTRIYIEWTIQTETVYQHDTINQMVNEPLDKVGGFETSAADSANVLSNIPFFNKYVGLYEGYGKSTYLKEKINGFKSSKESLFMIELVKAITTQMADPVFDSEALGRMIGLSKSQLYRKIKELTGYSTALYIRHIRLVNAAELLKSTERSVGEIADAVGFKDLSYFFPHLWMNLNPVQLIVEKLQKRNNSYSNTQNGTIIKNPEELV
ncbi:MAG: helix-turn-helix transcriptional regulator [Bacteroidota bacterium]|nr:helix-turn-helix transcriptional regulator [Bacteroidota bacterium]